MAKVEKTNNNISNNKQRKKMLTWGLIIALVCILILLTVLVFKNGKKENQEIENTGLYSEDVEAFDIATSYGNLVFPDEWNEYITTEVINENACETIQFWVELEGKEKIHVFDILFGGTGYKVGSIKVSNSEEIDVCIESYNYELDDSWSDADKEVLSSIEYDINYLLENLTSLENFSPIE